jgi:hypothetical protein
MASKARSAPAQAPPAAEHQRRRCIEARDTISLFEDNASAEETYARDDVGDDLGRSGITVEMHPDVYECRRADRDMRRRD